MGYFDDKISQIYQGIVEKHPWMQNQINILINTKFKDNTDEYNAWRAKIISGAAECAPIEDWIFSAMYNGAYRGVEILASCWDLSNKTQVDPNKLFSALALAIQYKKVSIVDLLKKKAGMILQENTVPEDKLPKFRELIEDAEEFVTSRKEQSCSSTLFGDRGAAPAAGADAQQEWPGGNKTR